MDHWPHAPAHHFEGTSTFFITGYQYWDKSLTFDRYTHENAVHHDVVREAVRYPWCSASWFEKTAKPSFVRVVRSVRIDAVKIYDDFTTRAVAGAPTLR